MATLELAIVKNWLTGTTVQESNWDRIRTPLIEWATSVNRNIEMVAKDAFGSSYTIDNDGSANLSTNLQTQINNIVIGTTSFSLAVDGDFLIQANNTQTNAGASTNETVGLKFGFGTDTSTGKIFFGKEQDYTTGPNSDSFFSVYTDLNGTLTEGLRVGSSGNTGIRALSKLFLDGTALTGDTYIYESAANVMDFVVGGSLALSIADTTSARFRNIPIAVDPTERIYLDGGIDTYIYEISSNLIYVTAGATNTFSIAATGLGVVATNKIFFDGVAQTGNTYIYESANDVLDIYVGGAGQLSLTTTFASFGQEVRIAPTERLYLDGGVDTYIYESAGNVLDFVVGSTLALSISDTTSARFRNIAVAVDAGERFYLDGAVDTYLRQFSDNVIYATAGTTDCFSITATGVGVVATNKLYFDGINQAGDTYIYQSADNVLDIYVGGAGQLSLTTTFASFGQEVRIAPTERLYLDGGTESYLVESAADTIDIVAGGTIAATFKETSAGNCEVLFDTVDPPTANYANTNGIIKAYVGISSTGAEGQSYNITSTSRTADPGEYLITWDTDFAAATYTVVGSAATLDTIFSIVTRNVGTVSYTTWTSAGALGNATVTVMAIGGQ